MSQNFDTFALNYNQLQQYGKSKQNQGGPCRKRKNWKERDSMACESSIEGQLDSPLVPLMNQNPSQCIEYSQDRQESGTCPCATRRTSIYKGMATYHIKCSRNYIFRSIPVQHSGSAVSSQKCKKMALFDVRSSVKG